MLERCETRCPKCGVTGPARLNRTCLGCRLDGDGWWIVLFFVLGIGGGALLLW